MVLNRLLLRSPLYRTFQFVHEHVQVFFNVHLLQSVDRLAFPVFERVTVRFRIDVHFLRQKKTGKKVLPLKEHVVFVGIFVVVGVFYGQNVVAETWDHEQLLIKAIHVADTAKVFDANMASLRFLIIEEFDVPVTFFFSAPGYFTAKLVHKL